MFTRFCELQFVSNCRCDKLPAQSLNHQWSIPRPNTISKTVRVVEFTWKWPKVTVKVKKAEHRFPPSLVGVGIFTRSTETVRAQE